MGFKIQKTESKIIRPKNFVEMRASLTPAESDVLDIIFCLMDNEGENDDKLSYTIDAHDFIGLFLNNKGEPMTVKRIYENIRNGVEGLYRVDLRFTQETACVKKGVAFRTVDSQGWNEGDYRMRINLTPMFKKIMIEEKKNNSGYALYGIRNQFALSGKYAKRLYPMLMRFYSTGVRYDNFEELRTKLAIPEVFSQSRYMGIIEKAIDEINELSDVIVSVKPEKIAVRGGYKIQTLTFSITEKLPNTVDTSDSEITQYVLDIFGDYINKNDAERIAEAAGGDMDRLKEAADFIKNYTGEIKDTTAMVISFIKSDWQTGKKKDADKSKINFNNFECQREYDDSFYAELERKLLGKDN